MIVRFETVKLDGGMSMHVTTEIYGRETDLPYVAWVEEDPMDNTKPLLMVGYGDKIVLRRVANRSERSLKKFMKDLVRRDQGVCAGRN